MSEKKARNCEEAVIEAVTARGGSAYFSDIAEYIKKHYKDRWGHQSVKTTVYQNYIRLGLRKDGHGGQFYVPQEGQADEAAAPVEEEEEQTQLSLERDLESALVEDLTPLEAGLRLAESGRQFATENGRIDLLCNDKDDNWVVVELKAGEAQPAVIAQTLSYMNSIRNWKKDDRSVRAIVVASGFAPQVVAAAKELPSISLAQYRVRFEFEAFGEE